MEIRTHSGDPCQGASVADAQEPPLRRPPRFPDKAAARRGRRRAVGAGPDGASLTLDGSACKVCTAVVARLWPSDAVVPAQEGSRWLTRGADVPKKAGAAPRLRSAGLAVRRSPVRGRSTIARLEPKHDCAGDHRARVARTMLVGSPPTRYRGIAARRPWRPATLRCDATRPIRARGPLERS